MKVARPFATTTTIIMSAATFDSFSFTTFVASATRDTASRLICTEQYFAAYFSRLRLLEAHDRQTLRVNRLAEGLLLFQAGRLLLIYFSEDLYFGSQFEHVLHFNIVRMEGLPGYFHLIGALYILMVVLMNRVIYFTNKGFSRTLLESLLIGGDCSVFIYQHFKVKKECIFWRYFLKQQKRGEGRGGLERLSWFNEEHLRISTLVLYFGVGLKNLLNVFFLLMLHLYLAEVFIVNLCYFSPIQSFTALLPLLLLYALNALLVLAGINALYHVLILTVTLGLLLMVVFVVGLRQAQQFALKEVLQQQQASAAAGNRRRYFLFCSRQLGRFLRHIDQLQRLLADASRVYGLAWFAFVLVNVPISSVLLMLLAMGKLRRQILLLAAILVGAQFLAINCISTASAVLSSRLHRPVRCLLGLLCCRNSGENLSLDRRRMMRISSLVALSVRLRLALHIQLFHTSNRLALSYGRYGKITFQSVGKILFFYLRFLIFAYKLVNTGQAHFGRQRPTLSSSIVD